MANNSNKCSQILYNQMLPSIFRWYIIFKKPFTVAVWTPKKFFPLLTRPQGSQGCQKFRFFFYKWKCFPFALRLPLEDTNFKKPSKLKKKCQINPVFLDSFEYSSIWGQSYRSKPQLACLVDPGASFDTPGTSGRESIVEIQEF